MAFRIFKVDLSWTPEKSSSTPQGPTGAPVPLSQCAILLRALSAGSGPRRGFLQARDVSGMGREVGIRVGTPVRMLVRLVMNHVESRFT